MEPNFFPIPLNALKEGAEHRLKRAKGLYEDAHLLSTHDRYATALSLLILSAEEAAMGLVIMEKLDTKEPMPEVEWNRWTRGSAHIKKLGYLRNTFRRVSRIDLFEPFNERELQTLKEFGLYIDWKKNREWSDSLWHLSFRNDSSLN